MIASIMNQDPTKAYYLIAFGIVWLGILIAYNESN